MTRSPTSTFIAASLIAAGALATSTAASAGTMHEAMAAVVTQAPAHVQVQVHTQPEHRARPRVVTEHRPVYVQAAPEWRHQQHAGNPNACGAPRWNPHQRYMPGQVVRRQGNLYVASGLSASVWNENSPPEWTPSYWVPAVCQY